MTGEEFVAEAGRRLASADYDVEVVELVGGPAVIGRRGDRVWFAQYPIRLRTTVYVAAVEDVDVEQYRRFIVDSFAMAKQALGRWPRGLNSAVASVPVLVSEHVFPAVRETAIQRPYREWGVGISAPAVVDLGRRRVYMYEGSNVLERIARRSARAQLSLVLDVLDHSSALGAAR
ncbi:MAG TPA: hypothetical protein VNA14_13530 [Mycobacteriales bacterium]|nr:hypothetical protein [Mycobacteriales bacterium]